ARTGDPVRATTFFEKAYRDDTLYLSAYRESCNLYRKQGNFKPMIEVLTLALSHGNDYWETNSALGQAFMGDGDPARAIERYKRALELNPRSYQTNIQLGQAYQTVKDFQKARECFNKAIEIDALRQEAVDALNKLNEQQRNAH
ncbi:MAG TPA: tetratricopeptide repeat protein, partial [Bacteroidota bacterium]|nr:tetratricopeptide repeat protein [Bacteroidota bacterium]